MNDESIIVAKLFSTMFVIGKQKGEDGDIRDAFGLHLTQGRDNTVHPHLFPIMMPFHDEGVDIGKDQIMCSYNLEEDSKYDELVNNYRQLVSGIVVARNMPQGV